MHNTVEVLIGVAPTCSICFISEAWGGQQSGILKKVEYGDEIMADCGFNVGKDFAVCGAMQLIPAFTRCKTQLSQQEDETTRQFVRGRVHVEGVIEKIITYKYNQAFYRQ